jgi:hypothetical protein
MPEPEPTPRPTADSIAREFDRLRGAVVVFPALRFVVERIPDEVPDPSEPDSPADGLRRPNSVLLRAGGDGEPVASRTKPFVRKRFEFRDFSLAGDRRIEMAPRPVRLAQKEQALAQRQEMFQQLAIELNQQLANERIRSDEWLRRMMGEVKDLHTTAYAIGWSGRFGEIPNGAWGEVGAIVQRQFRFLRRWRREIDKVEREDLSTAQMNDRAQKYGAAARESFQAGYTAEVGLKPSVLPAMPADGTTICMTRDKCRWAIQILSKENQDFNATWKLGIAEHCQTCLDRAQNWTQLEIRNGVMKSDPEPIFERPNG